jgi:hypothetical protein
MYMAENHLLQKLFSAGKLYFLLDDVPLKFDAKKLPILQFISLYSTDFCSFYSCRLKFHREGMLNLLIISWYTFLFNGHVEDMQYEGRLVFTIILKLYTKSSSKL